MATTVLAAITLLSGCASEPINNLYAPAKLVNSAEHDFVPLSHFHEYKIQVKNLKGFTIKDAEVEWRLSENNEIREIYKQNTDKDGTSKVELRVNPKKRLDSAWADYKSTAEVTVKAAGYESQKIKISSSSYESKHGSKNPDSVEKTIILIQSNDFLSKEIIQSNQYEALRNKILKFLNIIRIESLLKKRRFKSAGSRYKSSKDVAI